MGTRVAVGVGVRVRVGVRVGVGVLVGVKVAVGVLVGVGVGVLVGVNVLLGMVVGTGVGVMQIVSRPGVEACTRKIRMTKTTYSTPGSATKTRLQLEVEGRTKRANNPAYAKMIMVARKVLPRDLTGSWHIH